MQTGPKLNSELGGRVTPEKFRNFRNKKNYGTMEKTVGGLSLFNKIIL
jgi:hypothetical protein